MPNELVPVDYNSLLTLAEQIARSPLMPAAYRGKPADAAIAMLYGSECGLPPMTSLQRVVVVNGRPGLDSQGMVALVRSKGHSITGTMSDTEAVVNGKRGDNGDVMEVKFSIDDAKRAGLVKNGPWTQYPSDMLWSKAVSRLGRRLFADVLMGFSYTDDEVESFGPLNAMGPSQAERAEIMLDAVQNPPCPPEIAPAPTSTLRPPPGQREYDRAAYAATTVDSGTGEIVEIDPLDLKIDGETVMHYNAGVTTAPPEADDAMTVLAAIVRETKPDMQQIALKHYLKARFGDPQHMTPEMIQEATNVALGWPATAPDPEPISDEF